MARLTTRRTSIRRSAFPGERHDHRGCIETALDAAEEVCERRGGRLTTLRRRVLELIWRSHEPVGAYTVLQLLQAEREGAAPPTVYRAIDFLLAHGLIHRIESRNAFVGCDRPGESHAGQFLVCSDCGVAAELRDPRIDEAIASSAGEAGFAVERQVIELSGRCPVCAGRATHG